MELRVFASLREIVFVLRACLPGKVFVGGTHRRTPFYFRLTRAKRKIPKAMKRMFGTHTSR